MPATLEEIRSILKGIDQTQSDSPDGWWETSEGAEFGKKTLAELEYLLGFASETKQV